jgi:hypothetical protein
MPLLVVDDLLMTGLPSHRFDAVSATMIGRMIPGDVARGEHRFA